MAPRLPFITQEQPLGGISHRSNSMTRVICPNNRTRR